MILNDNIAKKVQNAIVERSVIKDYPECIVEWVFITKEDGGERGAYRCFCGTPLRYSYYYGNLHNQQLLCVGGVCASHMDNTYNQIKHKIVLTPSQSEKLKSFRGGNMNESVKRQLIDIYDRRVKRNPTASWLYTDLYLQVEYHHIEFLRYFLNIMISNIYENYAIMVNQNPTCRIVYATIKTDCINENLIFIEPLLQQMNDNFEREKIYHNVLANYDYDIFNTDYPDNILTEYDFAKEYFDLKFELKYDLNYIDDEIKNETIEDDINDAILVHEELLPLLNGDCIKEKQNLKRAKELLQKVSKDMFEKRVIWSKLKPIYEEKQRVEEEKQRVEKEKQRVEKEENEKQHKILIEKQIDKFKKVLTTQEIQNEIEYINGSGACFDPDNDFRLRDCIVYLNTLLDNQNILDGNYSNVPIKYEAYNTITKKIYDLETKILHYRRAFQSYYGLEQNTITHYDNLIIKMNRNVNQLKEELEYLEIFEKKLTKNQYLHHELQRLKSKEKTPIINEQIEMTEYILNQKKIKRNQDKLNNVAFEKLKKYIDSVDGWNKIEIQEQIHSYGIVDTLNASIVHNKFNEWWNIELQKYHTEKWLEKIKTKKKRKEKEQKEEERRIQMEKDAEEEEKQRIKHEEERRIQMEKLKIKSFFKSKK